MSDPRQPTRIIIDTDPGVDDAMAILLAFQSPELKVEGLTTVFGNNAVDIMTANALRLVEMVGQPDVPVAAGSGKPLLRPYTGEGWRIHGRNGFGEVEYPEADVEVDRRSAVQFIIETVMANPGEITLVPLGPLTNIALAVATEPRIVENVREVVLMGGAATVAGNASPVAEANIRNDPEAAYIVYHAGWQLTMAGLDVTTKSIITQEYLDDLKTANNSYTDFIHAISKFYLQAYVDRGGEGFAVHDSSAVAYVIDPGLFEGKMAFVDVETHSPHGFGQTVADWRGQRGEEPNVNVLVDVDSTRFLEFYRQRLSETPR